jgi:starvation-inducible DNA-binding protein
MAQTPGVNPTSPRIDIGINEEDRGRIADGLSKVLADSYTVYLMTHNFHWNVKGPLFNTLHLMFMTQYTELWTSIDDIAERIRALGFSAPGTYAQFGKLSSIKEPEGVPAALDMVAMLVKGHEAVTKTARQLFTVADDADDQPTADLMTQRMDYHEKTAWMLRSMLET